MDKPDQIAMQGAAEVEAPVVGVLADSLVRATQDPPSAGFSVATAMGRNELVYALSDATLVIAADAERGGTWAGAILPSGPGGSGTGQLQLGM